MKGRAGRASGQGAGFRPPGCGRAGAERVTWVPADTTSLITSHRTPSGHKPSRLSPGRAGRRPRLAAAPRPQAEAAEVSPEWLRPAGVPKQKRRLAPCAAPGPRRRRRRRRRGCRLAGRRAARDPGTSTQHQTECQQNPGCSAAGGRLGKHQYRRKPPAPPLMPGPRAAPRRRAAPPRRRRRCGQSCQPRSRPQQTDRRCLRAAARWRPPRDSLRCICGPGPWGI